MFLLQRHSIFSAHTHTNTHTHIVSHLFLSSLLLWLKRKERSEKKRNIYKKTSGFCFSTLANNIVVLRRYTHTHTMYICMHKAYKRVFVLLIAVQVYCTSIRCPFLVRSFACLLAFFPVLLCFAIFFFTLSLSRLFALYFYLCLCELCYFYNINVTLRISLKKSSEENINSHLYNVVLFLIHYGYFPFHMYKMCE